MWQLVVYYQNLGILVGNKASKILLKIEPKLILICIKNTIFTTNMSIQQPVAIPTSTLLVDDLSNLVKILDTYGVAVIP